MKRTLCEDSDTVTGSKKKAKKNLNWVSRQKVRCGEVPKNGGICSFSGERRNHKRHCQTEHPWAVEPYKIRNDAFGVGGRWDWRVTEGPVPDQQGDNPRVVDAGPVQELQPHVESAPRGAAVSSATETVIAPAQPHGCQLEPRVANLEKDQQRLFHLVKNAGEKAPPPAEASSTGAYDFALLHHARDISDVKKAAQNHIICLPDDNLVYCAVCRPDFDASNTMSKGGKAGLIKYEFSTGTSFPKPAVMPTAFSRLKESVREHLISKTHKRCLEAKTRDSEKEAKAARLQGSVSYRVIRTAYHVIKHSMPQLQFEKMITLQDINGLNMGNIGHSFMQMNRFRREFFLEVLELLTRHISRTACVAVMADKVTVKHRTIDITAVMAVVPEAPSGHLIQSFVVGAPVVKKHDGTSLANGWIKTLAAVGIKSPKQIAAICTDGQYHGLSVPSKFLEQLAKTQEDVRERSMSPCVPMLWDGAHLLALAEDSAKDEDKCLWVWAVVNSITRVTKRHTTGKGRELLRNAQKKLGLKKKCPRLWSTTRFAPHAAAVLKTFLYNMPAYLHCLEAEYRTSTARPDAIEVLRNDLRLLRDDVCFRGQVAALLDVYQVLAAGSRDLQSLQKLPWERQGDFADMVGKLTAMAGALKAAVRPKRSGALSTQAISEMLQEADEEELPELWPNFARHRPKLHAREVEQVITFTEALARHSARREEGVNKAGERKGSSNLRLIKAMPHVRMVADLDQLSSSPTSGVVDDMLKSVDRLRSDGLIPETGSTERMRDAMLASYKVIRAERMNKPNLGNQELFKILWQRAEQDIKPYINLVTRLWLISPCESVVESMGSVVADVFGEHRNLKHANAAMELVVRWNGPDLASADALIQAVVRSPRENFNFVRRHTQSKIDGESSVVLKHKKKCPRASVFR
ncbi:uncharacterized protein LOC122375015 isoform X2 [Amphibalanus amphitrite]|uniref:uncharacterized protein LOC122363735 isoform X2 n=1 Tax=Amphibalanus amphitrite TaxID=1232801 RepID=UPI001C914F75|nr:uncharacterized protein LOC122363735 isoform X2 [Amphibalanus amphitrite]XP_043210084.1 uncharacterized protein LOC122375015 isoform X2 [Amphibalanus amphitrite]